MQISNRTLATVHLSLLLYDKTKFKLNRKRKNKLTNGNGGVIIQLRAAIFERIRNAQINAVQIVSIFLVSDVFLRSSSLIQALLL